MFGLRSQLEALSEPLRVGIVGIGSIGKGMVLQTTLLPNIRCVAISDIILERATEWAEHLGLRYRIVETLDELDDAMDAGILAVCQEGALIARCERLDVFVEATNDTVGGARHGITAIEHAKHVVMMNYEADLMYGAYLLELADKEGVVYSVSDGDQPAVLKRLVEEMEFMSFKLVMAGNVKGFLDRYSDPTAIIPEADKRNLDYKMCVSYTDGTKLGIELAVLANGLNLHTTVPGMYGPRMKSIHEIFDHFDFDTLWDGNQGLVDYALGCTPKGGVFAIGYTDVPHQQDTLAWFPPDMGPGPYYLFYRPYHLGHFESMATVVEAAINGRAVLKPEYGFKTNVYAYAKRSLRRGEVLDGIGGYACYGMIENCDNNPQELRLPICLADNIRVTRDIGKDERILLTDTNYDPNDPAFELFDRSVHAAARRDKVLSNGHAVLGQ